MARQRSSKAEVRKHIGELGSRRPTLDDMVASYRAWLKCEDWVKDDGQFIMGLHRWVKGGKFEHAPEPAGKPAEESYGSSGLAKCGPVSVARALEALGYDD